jgi:stage III sporulation protein AG
MLLSAEKLSSLKKLLGKRGMGFAALGLVIGIILLLMPAGDNNVAETSENGGLMSSGVYVALLEEKAVGLIKEIDGVDDCKVFITLERGFRYVYATDQHVREDNSAKETDKTIVLANKDGGESPILIEETMPAVAGVAVVCKGASYETQYRIIELMCALFDIKSNRITVQS